MDIQFEVLANIQKPIDEVFDAIYQSEKLSQYFTSAGASGPLDAAVTVTWEFAEFPGPMPVRVLENIPNEKLVFEWGSPEGNHQNRVEVSFLPLNDAATKVVIKETGWSDTPERLRA